VTAVLAVAFAAAGSATVVVVAAAVVLIVWSPGVLAVLVPHDPACGASARFRARTPLLAGQRTVRAGRVRRRLAVLAGGVLSRACHCARCAGVLPGNGYWHDEGLGWKIVVMRGGFSTRGGFPHDSSPQCCRPMLGHSTGVVVVVVAADVRADVARACARRRLVKPRLHMWRRPARGEPRWSLSARGILTKGGQGACRGRRPAWVKRLFASRDTLSFLGCTDARLAEWGCLRIDNRVWMHA